MVTVVKKLDTFNRLVYNQLIKIFWKIFMKGVVVYDH